MSRRARARAAVRRLARWAGDLYQCSMCGQWSTEPAQVCSACR
ncbi:hypothetical protein ACFW61_36035 [Streptomyces microflavus]